MACRVFPKPMSSAIRTRPPLSIQYLGGKCLSYLILVPNQIKSCQSHSSQTTLLMICTKSGSSLASNDVFLHSAKTCSFQDMQTHQNLQNDQTHFHDLSHEVEAEHESTVQWQRREGGRTPGGQDPWGAQTPT